MDYLELYSERCLTCSHLVEGAPNTYADCHFSAGNKECPASELRIVASGKIRRAAKLIKEARANKDPEREAKVLQSIAGESDAFKHILYTMIS